MSVIAERSQAGLLQPLFTCLSCCIGFPTAEDQRVHYRSDHHRYNMKRRVASLPPVSAVVFNQKVLQRKTETAVTTFRGATCDGCNKTYTTENAYRSHINSKKHKENELKPGTKPKDATPVPPVPVPVPAPAPPKEDHDTKNISDISLPGPSSLMIDADADEDDINQTIDAKIAAARSRLTPNSCLFCPHQESSLEDSLLHMTVSHSFFIPDIEYLQDLQGLLRYLGEKVAVGNVCLFCNGKGREFRTIEAVWKHMYDKGHCKLAYDSEKDRLEISDFYDFSSSYPDTVKQGKKVAKEKQPRAHAAGDEDWEDIEDDGEEADEVIEEGDVSEEDEEADLPDSQITYGDSNFELVLPSGARIGHRSMRHYYGQSFPASRTNADPKSGTAIVRRLLADKRSDLVPVKAGFGAFGTGMQTIKARNRGEAREAGRHIREFRDQKRKEDYKTRVAFVHNHQKHFRDPLLQ